MGDCYSLTVTELPPYCLGLPRHKANHILVPTLVVRRLHDDFCGFCVRRGCSFRDCGVRLFTCGCVSLRVRVEAKSVMNSVAVDSSLDIVGGDGNS